MNVHDGSQARSIVADVARSLDFLDPNGNLVWLDSLMIVDMVVAIEERTGLEIVLEEIDVAVFSSLDSLAAVVDEAARARA